MRRPISLVAFVAAAFVYRLAYGLSMPFWFEDERQVYLVGLRAFARGEWPFFGADVVWTGGRVPGALLGWLIRAPLEIVALPEAPVVLLNLLSTGALALFAWYLTRRLPGVPRWLVWTSLFFLPWTLNFSTHVVNPSYIPLGSILFFVGFAEAMPALSRRIVPASMAWAFMGFGVFWTMQLHMSWVLLPPFVLAAFAGTLVSPVPGARWSRILMSVAGFCAGAALPVALLLPTWVRDGLGAGLVEGAVDFQRRGAFGLVSTAARMLAFASFEITRFVGLNTVERVMVFWRQPWLLPFAAILLAVGLAHPLWMAFAAATRVRGAESASAARDWRAIRMFLAGSILLVYFSFFWSVRGPQVHAYYVMWPAAVLYAVTCWEVRAVARGGRLRGLERIAMVAIAASVVLHAGLGIDRLARLSLYADRDLVVAAIADRNDRYLGDRRLGLIDRIAPEPGAANRVPDPTPFLTADPVSSIEVVRADWMAVMDRFSVLTITIANHSRDAAWVDIRYASRYVGESGQELTVRNGVIKRILQPGETRTYEHLSDDRVPAGARSVTVTVIDAERVIPRRERRVNAAADGS